MLLEELHKHGIYREIAQAFCVLTNCKSVGVMGACVRPSVRPSRNVYVSGCVYVMGASVHPSIEECVRLSVRDCRPLVLGIVVEHHIHMTHVYDI